VTSHKSGQPCNVEQFHDDVVMVSNKGSKAQPGAVTYNLFTLTYILTYIHTYTVGQASLRQEKKKTVRSSIFLIYVPGVFHYFVL
jgi:hypothetical protein